MLIKEYHNLSTGVLLQVPVYLNQHDSNVLKRAYSLGSFTRSPTSGTVMLVTDVTKHKTRSNRNVAVDVHFLNVLGNPESGSICSCVSGLIDIIRIV